jgi:hypothetical protein
MLLLASTTIVVSVILLFITYLHKIDEASGVPLIMGPLKNNSAGIGNISSITHPTKSPLVDKFGITEIYPTAPVGGREWYVNMSSPTNDTNFYLSGGGESTNSSGTANSNSPNGQLLRQNDGSYEVHGVRKTGKYDFSVRMNVNTTDSIPSWKNVEMTGYLKVISTNASDASIDWYARGRMHTSNSPCEGVAYHAGLTGGGTVFWQKEIWHTGGYTDSRSLANVTHPILGRWVGFKAIMYNANNDSAVRLQTYLDDTASNHWKKVMDTIDAGSWYANAQNDVFYSANCGRSRDYVILNAGPIATFRSDNMIWDFKDLSIREIQPPP